LKLFKLKKVFVFLEKNNHKIQKSKKNESITENVYKNIKEKSFHEKKCCSFIFFWKFKELSFFCEKKKLCFVNHFFELFSRKNKKKDRKMIIYIYAI